MPTSPMHGWRRLPTRIKNVGDIARETKVPLVDPKDIHKLTDDSNEMFQKSFL